MQQKIIQKVSSFRCEKKKTFPYFIAICQQDGRRATFHCSQCVCQRGGNRSAGCCFIMQKGEMSATGIICYRSPYTTDL